ncbi:MAG: NAD-dependent epimerase/dehydratase family protein [Acidobacteria bacterium]|nr:NAD-dependent epimerase/dehydratase family protein [Acidobacteriota bacterium]
MIALVTGVTGFTGGHLAHHLLTRGYRIRGLVRQRSLDKARSLEAAGLETVVGDLGDPRSLDEACRGVEVVFHVAATYREAGQPGAAYHVVNVEGTRHLLASAKRAGVRRFVHCSTGGVHGHVERPPASEDAPLRPGDVYQETKLEAETLAREFGRREGLAVTIVRPIGIYGPADTRFLKMFRGIARGRFPMLGSGEVFYHLTYIDDLVEGFRLCAEHDAAADRTYLLAGPEYTTLNELTELIARELGVAPPRWRLPVWPFWIAGAICEAVCVPLRVEPPLYRRRVDFYVKSRAFDISRARRELGYDPKVDLKTGIRRTVEWYRANRLL